MDATNGRSIEDLLCPGNDHASWGCLAVAQAGVGKPLPQGQTWRMQERDLLQRADDLEVDLQRAHHMFEEFLTGCRALHDVGPAVTVFGSARFKEDHRYYRLARETGRRLAEAGYTVITGGGPGIMEAANRGAREAGGSTVGCSIRLPKEQVSNAYLDREITFDYFFVRKVMLLKYSSGFVCMPGGVGTLDEIFETGTLIQTGKAPRFPLVVMGNEFWEPLRAFIRDRMFKEGTLTEGEVVPLFTDDPAEAAEHIRASDNGNRASDIEVSP